MLSLTDGETEAQGSLITCPRLYTRGMLGQGSEYRPVDSDAGSLTCVVPCTEWVGLIFINTMGKGRYLGMTAKASAYRHVFLLCLFWS